VPGLVWKIDREARENRVHGGDSPKAPTPVHAEAAGGQLNQGFDLASLYFPGRSQFFKFFSHKDQVSLASSKRTNDIKGVERSKTKRNCGTGAPALVER
ncbi:MAG: hypothetical protein ACTHLW_06735, partial [Verrucomicrobiota bacterium]